jgi:hypothetical protein
MDRAATGDAAGKKTVLIRRANVQAVPHCYRTTHQLAAVGAGWVMPLRAGGQAVTTASPAVPRSRLVPKCGHAPSLARGRAAGR